MISSVSLSTDACIVHDYLYGAQPGFGRENRKEDRKFADELHKQLMEAGVGWYPEYPKILLILIQTE